MRCAVWAAGLIAWAGCVDRGPGPQGKKIDPAYVAAHLLERTAEPTAPQVFTLHAELEGMRLIGQFEQLLLGWKAQGWQLGPTRALFEAVEPMALPRCTVALGTIPGRTGTLLVQGPEFLGDVDLALAA